MLFWSFSVFVLSIATAQTSMEGIWQSKNRNLCCQLKIDPANSQKYIATTLANLEANYVGDIHLDLTAKTARYYSAASTAYVSYNLSIDSSGKSFARGDKFDFDSFKKVSHCDLAPAITTQQVLSNIEQEEEKARKFFNDATDIAGVWKSTQSSVCLQFSLKNRRKGKYNVIPSTKLAGLAFRWVRFKYLAKNGGFWEGAMRAKLVVGCKLNAHVVVTSSTTLNLTHSQSVSPTTMVKLKTSDVAKECHFAAKFTQGESSSSGQTLWLDELHRRCNGACVFSLIVVLFFMACFFCCIGGFVMKEKGAEEELHKNEIKLAEVF